MNKGKMYLQIIYWKQKVKINKMGYLHDTIPISRISVIILICAKVWKVTVKWQDVFSYPDFATEITSANGFGKNRSVKCK